MYLLSHPRSLKMWPLPPARPSLFLFLLVYIPCPAELVASMEAFSSPLPHLFSHTANQSNHPCLNKKFLLPVFHHRSQSLHSLLMTRTPRTKKLPRFLASQQLVPNLLPTLSSSVIIETFVPPNPKDGPRPLLLHQSSANPSHQLTNQQMLPHSPRSPRSA